MRRAFKEVELARISERSSVGVDGSAGTKMTHVPGKVTAEVYCWQEAGREEGVGQE